MGTKQLLHFVQLNASLAIIVANRRHSDICYLVHLLTCLCRKFVVRHEKSLGESPQCYATDMASVLIGLLVTTIYYML